MCPREFRIEENWVIAFSIQKGQKEETNEPLPNLILAFACLPLFSLSKIKPPRFCFANFHRFITYLLRAGADKCQKKRDKRTEKNLIKN